MGKQRFRLSHMIPNAWFYRLRDMNTAAASGNTTASHNKKPLLTSSQRQNNQRNSFCYTPKLHQVYTSSPNKNTIFNKPPSSKHVLGSIYIQPTDLTPTDQDLFLSPTSSYYESPLSEPTRSLDKLPSTYCGCGVTSTSMIDAKVEFNRKSYTKEIQDSSGCQEIELQKPPQIITKSKRDASTIVEKKNEETCSQNSISIKRSKETRRKKPVVKIRPNSSKTKVCKRMVHGNNDHKRLSSSCCIVKSTFDPQKDLRESMMEMIVENNIRSSKDLEKLLACYLSLNSNNYHDTIIKAFEEIWMTFDFVA